MILNIYSYIVKKVRLQVAENPRASVPYRISRYRPTANVINLLLYEFRYTNYT